MKLVRLETNYQKKNAFAFSESQRAVFNNHNTVSLNKPSLSYFENRNTTSTYTCSMAILMST